MILKNEIPLLEYDDDKNSIVNPLEFVKYRAESECLVFCFFPEQIKILTDGLQEHFRFITGTSEYPLFYVKKNGQPVGLMPCPVSAPLAAGALDQLCAAGFTKFMVTGGCGVLNKEIQCGKLIVPECAVRDEGTSYHYLSPARDIAFDPKVVELICSELEKNRVPHLRAKTWTTDAIYRETREKVNLRKAEGCLCVEMEAAALAAVAQFRNVKLGQILYAGDDVSGQEWDRREWVSREDVRRHLLDLCLDIVVKM